MHGDISFDYTDGDLYADIKVGADTVRKKLGKLNFVLSTSVGIYYRDLNNVRTTVNAKITYTYKDGVLSHSVTSTSTGDTCTVSKTIEVS